MKNENLKVLIEKIKTFFNYVNGNCQKQAKEFAMCTWYLCPFSKTLSLISKKREIYSFELNDSQITLLKNSEIPFVSSTLVFYTCRTRNNKIYCFELPEALYNELLTDHLNNPDVIHILVTKKEGKNNVTLAKVKKEENIFELPSPQTQNT